MKHLLTMMIAISMVLPAIAQQKNDDRSNDAPKYGVSFVGSADNMPDPLIYLPAPPVNGSREFVNDSIMYEWGKSIRDTERGRIAVEDVDASIEYFYERFAPAIGIKLTVEKCPELTYTLKGMLTDIRSSIQHAKKTYARVRPYNYFHEKTPVPSEERANDNTSYPSGHSIRGWGTAMLLSVIYPEHASEIFKIGYEYCQSRVIVGFHFQSDIDAARTAASATFARLCGDQKFMDAVEKCKKERLSITDATPIE